MAWYVQAEEARMTPKGLYGRSSVGGAAVWEVHSTEPGERVRIDDRNNRSRDQRKHRVQNPAALGLGESESSQRRADLENRIDRNDKSLMTREAERILQCFLALMRDWSALCLFKHMRPSAFNGRTNVLPSQGWQFVNRAALTAHHCSPQETQAILYICVASHLPTSVQTN